MSFSKHPGNIKATYIWSAFWIVDNRCAMAMVVLPFAAWSRAAWTTFSEFESSADVAWNIGQISTTSCLRSKITSSNSSTFGFRSNARAMAMRSLGRKINRLSSEEVQTAYVFVRQITVSPFHRPQCQSP
jgi:hypothetical protein